MAGMPPAHLFLLMVFVMLTFHDTVYLCTTVMMRMCYGNGSFGLGGQHPHEGDCYDC